MNSLDKDIRKVEFLEKISPWYLKWVYTRALSKLREQKRIAAGLGYQLSLCYQHRQEDNHSHFSDHNCDYCKAMAGDNAHKKKSYMYDKQFGLIVERDGKRVTAESLKDGSEDNT